MKPIKDPFFHYLNDCTVLHFATMEEGLQKGGRSRGWNRNQLDIKLLHTKNKLKMTQDLVSRGLNHCSARKQQVIEWLYLQKIRRFDWLPSKSEFIRSKYSFFTVSRTVFATYRTRNNEKGIFGSILLVLDTQCLQL